MGSGVPEGTDLRQGDYTRENYLQDLNRALYYGVGIVLTQGIDPRELVYQIRAEQGAGRLGGARLFTAGRGIGAPNAGPGAAAYQGIAYEITTEEEARRTVQELVAKKVDVVKIWVDDRGGRAPRLSSVLYRAVIDEAHKHGASTRMSSISPTRRISWQPD